MNKIVILIIVCAVILSTVLPVSSEIVKNEKNSLSKITRISNFNKKDLDFQKYDYLDFPVMHVPLIFLEPDETSPKPIAKTTPSQFNWMKKDGKDWTTSAKNQGNCGSCWAFAALGALESVIKIKEDCADLNPDLSEQYILSCLPKSGSCHGGNSAKALKLIMETTPDGNYHNGIIPESCFEYYANDNIPCSKKCENWEEKLVPLLDYGSWKSDGSNTDIERIKTEIIEKGPVVAYIMATESFKIWGGTIHNPNAYFYHLFSLPFGFVNHVVIIVGWKDSSLVPNGGYWICKNSWGQEWGYDGFFNVAYKCLNIDRHIIVWADYDPHSFDWPPYVDTGGPYGGYPNQEVTFDASKSMGFEGNIIDYSWDFGDENTGSGKITTHTYENLGKYTITLTVEDSKGNIATKTTNLWIQETNDRPDKPTINGPSNGKTWRTYEYSFSSTDPDGNDLLYYIDWGDNRKEEWIGPYASGEEIALTHLWTTKNNNEIKVKVKDPYNEESDWETLNINIPRARIPFRLLFFDFIKNFFYLFK